MIIWGQLRLGIVQPGYNSNSCYLLNREIVAILAQTKPLNSKVRRLQAMLEIRRLVVEGHSYDQIQQTLGLSKRTFYRYLNRVFEEDKRVLEEKNYEELMRQLVILRDRYNENYQLLRAMATDPKVKPYDKLHILGAMKVLADTIVRLYRDAPALSIVQRRKLEGLENGVLYFDNMRASLGPAGVWPPPIPQQQDNDDLFLPSNSNNSNGGDGSNEEERRDW
jgi:uncharacterized protein YerC